MPEPDHDHPVMRMLSALLDAAIEFGLTREEVADTLQEVTCDYQEGDPIASPIIDELAQLIEAKGESGEAFRSHVSERTGPLYREARAALGFD
jgi:hypothetical protein